MPGFSGTHGKTGKKAEISLRKRVHVTRQIRSAAVM